MDDLRVSTVGYPAVNSLWQSLIADNANYLSVTAKAISLQLTLRMEHG